MATAMITVVGLSLAVGLMVASSRSPDLTSAASPFLTIEAGATKDFAFAATGQRPPVLCTVGSDGDVRLWDLAHGRNSSVLQSANGPANALALSPNGELLATGSVSGDVQVWNVSDVANPVLQGQLGGHDGAVSAVAFSADGSKLAGSRAGNLQIWDIRDPLQARIIAQPYNPFGPITALTFSPDGTTLAVGIDGGEVDIWDLASLRRMTATGMAAAPFRTIAISPDGASLAVPLRDGDVFLWNLPQQKAGDLRLLKYAGSNASVSTVAFTPDGRNLVIGTTDGKVSLSGLTDVSEGTVVTAGSDAVTKIGFSADSRVMITATVQGAIRLWDFQSIVR
jgi:eukaryotic-like serine/threonine-protein kinase